MLMIVNAYDLSTVKANDIRVGFGARVLAGGYPSPLDENEVRMDVEEIIIHPEYSRLVNKCIK